MSKQKIILFSSFTIFILDFYCFGFSSVCLLFLFSSLITFGFNYRNKGNQRKKKKKQFVRKICKCFKKTKCVVACVCVCIKGITDDENFALFSFLFVFFISLFDFVLFVENTFTYITFCTSRSHLLLLLLFSLFYVCYILVLFSF